MWQRIQSVYMLVATVLMTVMFFTPLARFTPHAGEPIELMVWNYIWIAILVGLAALLPFVTIWLFKDRFLQIRLLVAEIVLLVGAEVFAVVYALRVASGLADISGELVNSYRVTILFPVISIVLVWLAIRGIAKDQRKINSLNRIR